MQLGSVGAILTGTRGDPLAQVDREIGKSIREEALANAEVSAAQKRHDASFEAGGSDEEVDSAAREIVLAKRRLVRAGLRLSALNAQKVDLATKATAERRRLLESAALVAGVEHGKAARKSNETAVRYIEAIGALQAHGFAEVARNYPLVPTNVFSLENQRAGAVSLTHTLLERFCWVIEGFKEKGKAS